MLFSLRFNNAGKLAAGLIAAGAIAASLSSAIFAKNEEPNKAPDATCPIPPLSDRMFHTFARPYAEVKLSSTLFRELKAQQRFSFGHTFDNHEPLLEIAQEFSIYGYDYVGAQDGYMLFYRRPVNWVQTMAPPQISAPNGELLPPLTLPSDLDPRWPSPELLVQRTPFQSAIVLTHWLVAYPCGP